MRVRISPADAALVMFVGLAWGLLAPATKVLFAADRAIFDGLSVVVARGSWALPLFAIMLGVAWLLERPHSGRAVAHVIDSPSTAWWFLGEIILASTILAQTAFARAVPRLGVAVATIGAEYTALAVGIAASVITHEPWNIGTVIAGVLLCAALATTFVPLPRGARVGGGAA